MNKQHAYIYSYEGMTASLLGYILQQSGSYKSKFFKMDQSMRTQTDDIIEWEPHTDPWDNHEDSSTNAYPDWCCQWSHDYIESLEDGTDNFSWFEKFIDTFKYPSIFGLSYGNFSKKGMLDHKDCQVILSYPKPENYDLYRKLFVQSYWERPFTPDDLAESVDMHVHDHCNDSMAYKRVLMKKIKPAYELATKGQLKFWQLQLVYHHELDEFPFETPENLKMRDQLFEQEVVPPLPNLSKSFKNNPDVLMVDIFDLDLKDLCETLGVEHNSQMDLAYQEFMEFCREFSIT